MKTLIVDDERLARVEMRRLLRVHPDIEVIGEAENVPNALTAIDEMSPELVFLDIKMPGQSGFDLLHQVERVPEIIFTTAHDEFAIRAFEMNALDYLLKPIEPDRLSTALDRVRDQLRLQDQTPRGGYLTLEDRVFVRDGEKYWFVSLGEIPLFESEGNYTRLHIGTESPFVHRSLNYLDKRLDPRNYFRANRKQIINLRFVESLNRSLQGGLLVRLKGGREIEMSRRRAQEFREKTSL